MKTTLIIKDPSSKIKIYSDHMIVTSNTNSSVIGFRHIKELYINKTIVITPSEMLKMASFFELFFIDHHGYILATIKLERC